MRHSEKPIGEERTSGTEGTVSYTPYESQVMPSQERSNALDSTSPANARRLYKKAWTAALLGFVLLVLSSVLDVFFWERFYDHGNDFQDIVWLSMISGIFNFIGIAFVVWSIVLVIRGILADEDKQHTGAVLIATLRKLELVAIIALILYLAAVPLSLLASVLGSYYLMIFASSGPAFLFLAALPLIVAHALHKAHS